MPNKLFASCACRNFEHIYFPRLIRRNYMIIIKFNNTVDSCVVSYKSLFYSFFSPIPKVQTSAYSCRNKIFIVKFKEHSRYFTIQFSNCFTIHYIYNPNSPKISCICKCIFVKLASTNHSITSITQNKHPNYFSSFIINQKYLSISLVTQRISSSIRRDNSNNKRCLKSFLNFMFIMINQCNRMLIVVEQRCQILIQNIYLRNVVIFWLNFIRLDAIIVFKAIQIELLAIFLNILNTLIKIGFQRIRIYSLISAQTYFIFQTYQSILKLTFQCIQYFFKVLTKVISK
ncbi:transmembrane protein, putative (macronuclear) [Tetrahymena thermophila SB210]|uniref:Transmembrane protein, putative n=1 Tax=Tetrahymena thermophila (strain SB210) TaxID=312017 RepID=W7X3Q3_TETTS|nr:transmembrane protein, putative [Tetrahymena thermophila SB210]EWS71048.1 transmembrane protein, putative [Tetrahymena thermophila SB210]|eukprot:XP_012656414.1 transmembrane protein, putative [Tetrahymena thermophila SB210]